jgi:hypothetical protein
MKTRLLPVIYAFTATGLVVFIVLIPMYISAMDSCILMLYILCNCLLVATVSLRTKNPTTSDAF